MDLKHEIFGLLFHNNDMKDRFTVEANELKKETAEAIQQKLESHMNSIGQEILIENIKSAVGIFKLEKMSIKKDGIKVIFNGHDIEAKEDISLIIDLDNGGYIKEYDIK